MVKRNRKKKTMNSFVFPVPFAGVVVLLSSFALVYVWLCSRCDSLGKDLKGMEKQRAILLKKLSNEECRWSRLKAPESINRALVKWNINMSWPRRDQVVWLYDPGYLPGQLTQADTYQLAKLTKMDYSRIVMNE